MSSATRTEERLAQYAFVIRDLSGDLESYWRRANVPKVRFEEGKIREGGAIFPLKENTVGEVENATLERGLVPIRTSLWDWLTECGSYTAGIPFGSGVASPGYMRDIAIDQLRRDRSVAMTVTLFAARIISWQPGNFDNEATEIQVEIAEVSYEGLDIAFY